jgi:phosphatidylinositol alpha-1,6-mannosyltransferase
MRIAIVSPEFPPDIGGVETYALEYVKELASRGHEVMVFTIRHARGEADLPGVRVEPVLRLCQAIDRETFARFSADVWHALNAAYAWIAHEQPNGLVSVHGNDFLRPYYPIAQPDLRRFPLAWRWSGVISEGLRPLWIRMSDPVVRQSLARAPHIIANSRFTERVLLERIPACRGRTSVGFVGVGAHFFDVAWQPAADRIPRLLTVSRLSEARKNVDRVLHALSRLKEHEFRYVIVGDGHDRTRLERLAADLQLGQRVRFTGFVNRAELLDIYAHSDLMVLASGVTRDSHEGFGIVYLEAAASGVPSLAAGLGGAAEAVDEGSSGMYVEEPTVDAIADALARFFGGQIRFDPEACRNFARRFTWASVVDHSLKYYGDSAREASPRPRNGSASSSREPRS